MTKCFTDKKNTKMHGHPIFKFVCDHRRLCNKGFGILILQTRGAVIVNLFFNVSNVTFHAERDKNEKKRAKQFHSKVSEIDHRCTFNGVIMHEYFAHELSRPELWTIFKTSVDGCGCDYHVSFENSAHFLLTTIA
jgi:hypothetical protein